jgi:hypothetical protein
MTDTTYRGRLSEMDKIDWSMLAYDISDMFSNNYPYVDVIPAAVKPNLPAFIEACLATQAELDKKES